MGRIRTANAPPPRSGQRFPLKNRYPSSSSSSPPPPPKVRPKNNRPPSAARRARPKELDYFSHLPARFKLNPSSNLKIMDYASATASDWVRDLHFVPSFRDALHALGVLRPNPMQCAVIPRLSLPTSHLLFAAETGSGKTLAYLLPIMRKLKEQEAQDPTCRQTIAAPRALILLPSNELVNQVHAVAKTLSHHVKLRVEKVSGAQDPFIRGRNLAGTVDLVIGTPSQLLQAAHPEGPLNYAHVRHLAVDEADTLLSEDFAQQVTRLLQTNQLATTADTISICSATIPYSLTTLLPTLLPNIEALGSPRLHMPSRQVDIRFLDICLPGDARYRTILVQY